MKNVSMAMILVLVSSMALPTLARKKKANANAKKVEAVEEKKTVEAQKDPLAPNDRKRFDYCFLEAARQHALGNYAAAFDLFEHARQIDPNAAEVYYYLSLYYPQLNNDSLSALYMQKAIELSPDNQTYAEHLAQYYITHKQYEEAIDAYEQLYAHNHKNTDALRILAQLYQQQKDYPKLLNTISRLELEEGESEQFTLSKMRTYELMDDRKAAYQELKSLCDQHPLDMNYKTMLGNWLMQHNRTKEAYKLFSDVLKEEPDNSYAQMSIYDYYRAVGDETHSQDMLDKILLSKKTDLDTKAMMFRSFIQENESHGGDSTKVIALFDRALSVPQPSAEIAEMKATYMNLKKMPADSVNAAYKRVLQLAPDNVSSRIQLIQNLWSKKDYDAVVAQALAAQQYNPEEMVFYYFSGIAYYQKQEEKKALDEFRRGVAQINQQSSPDLVSDLYAMMGDILHKMGDKKEAFAAYDSCLQWKDDNVMALNNYAYYMGENGEDLHRAESMSYKTIKAEPNNGTYLDTYAWILFKQERYADAKTYIDAALKNRDSTENNSTVLEHAGDIYAMNGMADEAVDYWKKAYDDDHKTAVLEWKIKNKQYISEEALKRKQSPALPRKGQSTTKLKNKKGRK